MKLDFEQRQEAERLLEQAADEGLAASRTAIEPTKSRRQKRSIIRRPRAVLAPK